MWPTMAEEGEDTGSRREVWLRMILRASAIINIELRSGDLVLSDWPNVTRSITRWCHNDALILVGGEGVLVGGYFVLPASPVNTSHCLHQYPLHEKHLDTREVEMDIRRGLNH